MLVVSRIPMRKMHAVSVPPNLAAPLLAVLTIVRRGRGAASPTS